ncbi:hypothetical protein Tco_0712390 [Tanacetum coccineum]
MIAKDGTVSKFPGKFPGYTPSKEEEEEPEKKGSKEALEKGTNYEFLSYVVSDKSSKPSKWNDDNKILTLQSWSMLCNWKTSFIKCHQVTNNVTMQMLMGGGMVMGGNNICSLQGFMHAIPKDIVDKRVPAMGPEAAIGMSWLILKALLVKVNVQATKLEKLK